MNVRPFVEVVKGMIHESNPKVAKLAHILGKPEGMMLDWANKDCRLSSPLYMLQLSTFAKCYQLFSDVGDIEEFNKLTTGSKQAFMSGIINDSASTQNFANRLGVPLEALVRHLRGTRTTEKTEAKLTMYFKNGHGEEAKVHSVKEVGSVENAHPPTVDDFFTELGPLIAMHAQATGKVLHRFVFEKSTPETRAMMRKLIGPEIFEHFRLAVLALGSETSYKQILENQKLTQQQGGKK